MTFLIKLHPLACCYEIRFSYLITGGISHVDFLGREFIKCGTYFFEFVSLSFGTRKMVCTTVAGTCLGIALFNYVSVRALRGIQICYVIKLKKQRNSFV